jgi:DNA topoisomerase-1
VFSGRYGPYVKHGNLNASLPEGVEPEDVTMAVALELLQQRKERDAAKKPSGGGRQGGGKGGKGRSRKAPARGSSGKK